MKRKILCFSLMLALLFSSFGLFIFAAETESSDATAEYNLLDEIKANFSWFDESKYTEETPAMLGITESGHAGEGDVECLYVYMYSPGFEPDSLYTEFQWMGSSETDIEYYSSANKYMAFHSSTDDMRFHKFKLWVEPGLILNTVQREYWFYGLSIPGYGFLDITNYFIVEENDDGSYTVTYDYNELVELNVGSTTYRTNSTNEKYMYDQVASVYFSIPKEYQDYYDYLYSLTSVYNKIKIPFLLAAMKDAPEDVYNFWVQYSKSKPNDYRYMYTSENGQILSSGYGNAGGINFISDYYYGYPKGHNFSTPSTNVTVLADSDANYKDFFEFSYCDYENSKFYDSVIDSEIISKDIASADLSYFESEYVRTKHTVEDSWDSISYSYDAGFWDYWEDFGVSDAFKYLFLKNNPEKLAAFLEERGIAADGFNFENEPYLLKVDSSVISDIQNMNKVDFCDKYAIGYNDYSDFVYYCNTNENVVLYRFAVDDYLSMPVKIYELTSASGPSFSSLTEVDGHIGIVEEYVYQDFQIIEIEMYKNGEFSTLMVNHDPIDIVGDVEGIEPTPDLPSWSEIVGGVGDYVEENVKNFFGGLVKENPLFKVLRIVLIIAAVVVVGFLIVQAVRLIISLQTIRSLRSKNKKE